MERNKIRGKKKKKKKETRSERVVEGEIDAARLFARIISDPRSPGKNSPVKRRAKGISTG